MDSKELSDPSTLRTSGYERFDMDYYPTPREVVEAILPFLPEFGWFWEPCCGNGAISKVLGSAFYLEPLSTDIKDYGYPGMDGIHDFLNDPANEEGDGLVIVTNPPYNLSREFVARALELPNVSRAFFLLRHEWDAPAKSLPLVQHPSFKCKYVLKRRPRWIEGTTTAPRFPYAWYEWDKSFTGRPTMIYGV